MTVCVTLCVTVRVCVCGDIGGLNHGVAVRSDIKDGHGGVTQSSQRVMKERHGGDSMTERRGSGCWGGVGGEEGEGEDGG